MKESRSKEVWTCCWMEAKWGWHVRGRLDRRMNKICKKDWGRIVED